MSENNTKKSGRRILGWIIGALAVIIFVIFAVYNLMIFSAWDAKDYARSNLGAIYTAQSGYFSETKTYGSSFFLISWSQESNNIYGLCIGEDYIPPSSCMYQPERNIRESIGQRYGDCEARIREINAHAERLCREFSGASSKGFTALAISNIDSDPDPDTWTINNDKQLRNLPVSDL